MRDLSDVIVILTGIDDNHVMRRMSAKLRVILAGTSAVALTMLAVHMRTTHEFDMLVIIALLSELRTHL